MHIYRDKKEVAKITGKGKYVTTHSGKKLLKPSQVPKKVRNDINTLIKYIKNKLE